MILYLQSKGENSMPTPEQNQSDFTPLEHRYLDERFKYIDERFDSIEKMFLSFISNHEKLTAAEKESTLRALEKSEALIIHNQEVGNKYREQLKEQAESFITKAEYNSRHENVETKISSVNKEIVDLREFKSSCIGGKTQLIESKDSSKWVIGTCIALAGLIIAFAVYIADRSNHFESFISPAAPTVQIIPVNPTAVKAP